jgi:hypothetical protein
VPALKQYNALATPQQSDVVAIVGVLVKVALAVVYYILNDPTDPTP